MIVRASKDRFILIRQHDHAFLSGVFAEKLRFTQHIQSRESVLYAISNHDVGWEDLDINPLWDEERNSPYSFITYPLNLKMKARKVGVSIVEKVNPYGGYLCSRHYSSFFTHSLSEEERVFAEFEHARQKKLLYSLTPTEKENIEANVELLRFCDDLSLALCLNEPQENTYPWYQNGIQYKGEVYHWEWKDERAVSLSPNLFSSSFMATLPYTIVNRDRQVGEQGVYKFYIK